jgi:hypothetical protein
LPKFQQSYPLQSPCWSWALCRSQPLAVLPCEVLFERTILFECTMCVHISGFMSVSRAVAHFLPQLGLNWRAWLMRCHWRLCGDASECKKSLYWTFGSIQFLKCWVECWVFLLKDI